LGSFKADKLDLSNYGGDEDALPSDFADSLRRLFKAALHESFRYSGWDGVFDSGVNAFLDQYPQKNPE